MIKPWAFLVPHQYFQLAAALSATMSMISDGMQYSWSSPSLPILRSEESPIKITQTDEAWLEAMYLVAGLVGLPITPFVVDRLGRRKSILLASGCNLIAWIIMSLANHVVYFYVGRFISGVSGDLIFVIVPMYISEIADKEIRGFLTALVYVMMVFGIIIMYSIGPFVPLFVPPIVGASILSIHLVTFWLMPESPYFLVSKKKQDKALESLKKLKGEDKCQEQLAEISEALSGKIDSQYSIKDVICKRSTLIALASVTIATAAQHYCGFSAILMNLHTILDKADIIYFDFKIAGIIVSLVKLSAVIVSSFTVDKYGRKPLLIYSTVLSGLSLMGLGIYFHLKNLHYDVESVSWLPILFIVIYAAVFNIGLGVVPKVIASELFSNEFKAIGMTFGDGVYNINGCLSVLLYNYLAHNIDVYLPFYVYGCVSFVVALLTVFVIPETKGKSLEDIQAMLDN